MFGVLPESNAEPDTSRTEAGAAGGRLKRRFPNARTHRRYDSIREVMERTEQNRTTHHMGSDCAERERRRRKEAQSFREVARSLVVLLTDQIHADVRAYNAAFPEERGNIEIIADSDSGDSRIARSRDAESRYRGISPEVTFRFELERMVFECEFSHRRDRSREFGIVPDVDGNPRFVEMTIEELSEYLLKPVLFDKLPDTD